VVNRSSGHKPRGSKGREHELKGRLIIVGGGEDKCGDCTILREIAAHAKRGPLIVCSVASDKPDEQWETYRDTFRRLGAKHVVHFAAESRAELLHTNGDLSKADVVFFTGGDQLKITSKIAGTDFATIASAVLERGGVVAGTSAGAAVMCETMIIGDDGEETHRIGKLRMAPGLGLARGIVFDQHFAERGRIGRMLGALAYNPGILGIGIDEDTGVVLERGRELVVIGSGAVYILDGRDVTHTNVAHEKQDQPLSLFGLSIHVLSQADRFDLETRTPTAVAREEFNGAAKKRKNGRASAR
jgi:cyanophycinase